MSGRTVILAITGASGAAYGLRVGRELIGRGIPLGVIVSRAGMMVLREECRVAADERSPENLAQLFGAAGSSSVTCYREDDLLAPVASGSARPAGMIVCPCSMGTLSRIACGNSGNLIERAADVMLKEGLPLVLVPRETPLNEIHLENMLRLARAGARIVPAMPAFYHHPESVEEIIAFVAGKVLDVLGVENSLFRRWGESPGAVSKAEE